jgi:hypothetical protein
MTVFLIAIACVAVFTGVAGWAGMQIMNFLRARVDELLPDRMVDYCGFIPGVNARD